MNSKSRDKFCGSEINSARSKLDGVLQTLMIKTEDSPEPSENGSSKTSPELVINDPMPVVTYPKKSSTKPPRKRRRKDDGGNRDAGYYHHSYVMKLCDRSVDLAQFGEDTPLYPICRAWMHNQPMNRQPLPKSRSPSPEPESAQTIATVALTEELKDEPQTKDIYHLPPPLPRPVDEFNRYKDLRIPSPIPQNEEPLNIYADPESAPSREKLMLSHMERWKAIRQKWKEAAFVNESRYKESLSLLKTIFEQ